VINPSGQGKTAGVTYTCPEGKVSGCNVNGLGVGGANSDACVAGSYIYCVDVSGTTGSSDSDGFVSPGDLSGVNLIAVEKQGVTPKNALKSGLLFWRPDSNFGANGQTNPYNTQHFKRDDHTDFKKHAVKFIAVSGVPDTYNLQSVSTGKFFTYSGNRTWKTVQNIPAGDTSYNILFKKGPNTGIIRMSVELNGSRIYFWLGDNWKLDGSDNNSNIKGVHVIDVVETTLGSSFRMTDNTFYTCEGGAIGCNDASGGVGDFTQPRCVTDSYMYCRKYVEKSADDTWVKKTGEDYACTSPGYTNVGCEVGGKANIEPLNDTKCPVGSNMFCYSTEKKNVDRSATDNWRKRPGEKYTCTSTDDKPDIGCNNEQTGQSHGGDGYLDDTACPYGSPMYCYWDTSSRGYKQVNRTAEQTWRKKLDESYSCVSPTKPDVGCNNDQVAGWATMTETQKAQYYGVPLDNGSCPENSYMYCYWDKNSRDDVIPREAETTWSKVAGKSYKCISADKPDVACNDSSGTPVPPDDANCPAGNYMYCYWDTNTRGPASDVKKNSLRKQGYV